MMTVLTSIAGIVVVFSMCIPFNKYRSKAMAAVLFVASFLGLMLPTAYIGGQAIGGNMLAFDKAAGQTIFDSRLFREMFRPMNSSVIMNLINDENNLTILRIFIYVAVPAFILTRFAVENFARKEYKDVKLHRAFRIGRRLMLTAGFVLILESLMSIISLAAAHDELKEMGGELLFIIIAIIIGVLALIHIVIGVIGYKVWKDPTKKLIKVGFVSSIVLFVLAVLPVILTGHIDDSGNPLLFVDNAVTLVIAIGYIIGAIIVRANYKLAREKRVS